MKRFLGTILGATAAVVLAAAPAAAQEVCAEGTTSGGDCVNPVLAEAQRQTAIIYSQPKISQTAFPVLPVEDRIFRYPNALIPDPLTPSGIGVVPPPPSP